MRITVHRGTREIGGSCIEVATNHTHIILDAGLPLVNDKREPFDSSGLRDKSVEQLIADGTAPNVEGLFNAGKAPRAIFLSHSHQDHSGLLHLTKPEIPIYASKGTSKLLLAGAVFAGQTGIDKNRYCEIVARTKYQIGDVEITPFNVDHSAFDSMAFLIQAEGKRLLYSGDLRLHGRKPGMARDLLQSIADRPIDALLMEGTHFGSERECGGTEPELEKQLVEYVKAAPTLVLACFSPLDVDRLVSYYNAARRTERTFVVDAYTAFVMHLVAGQAKIPRPTADRGIRVFFNESFRRRNLDKLASLFACDRIDLDEVVAKPGKHLMTFRTSMTKLDFRGQLPDRSRCLYSYWPGYLIKPEWLELKQQIAEIGGDFIPAHVSGHIYVADILQFVRAVNPKLVFPIHTMAPENFRVHFDNACLLEDGTPFEIV